MKPSISCLPLRPSALALGALVALALSACGKSDTVEFITPVAVNTEVPSATLTTAQTQQVNATLAALTPDTASSAINTLSALQADVGYSSAVSQALGVANAASASASNAAVAGLVKAGGASYAITALTTFSKQDNGQPSVAYQSALSSGEAALSYLAPSGTNVAGLSAATQTEIGVTSAVQTLRVISAVIGTGDLVSAPSTSATNSAIAANYTAAQQARLEQAAGLLVKTAGPAKAALSDGTAVGNAVIDTLSTSLANAMVDGQVSATELQGVVAAVRARITTP